MSNPYPQRFLDLLEDTDGRVLDCGAGGRTRAGVVALDYETTPNNTVQADALDLPFRADTFELVLSQAVLEHVTDPQRYIDEITRVLEPGGRLYLEVAFLQPIHMAPTHFFGVTTYGIRHLCRALDIIETGTVGWLHETWDWIANEAGAPDVLTTSERLTMTQTIAKLDATMRPDQRERVASGVTILARKPWQGQHRPPRRRRTRMSTITVVNNSTVPLVRGDEIELIAAACQAQFEYDFGPDWGMARDAYAVTTEPGGDILAMIIDDDPSVPGALAYHDDPNAKPDIVVLAKTIMDNGGTWLDGPLSVSSALSHEVLELAGDPSCNFMADKGDGTSYAIEVADPVEQHVYPFEVQGVNVTVSDYVLRRWFDPTASGDKFDKLGVLTGPFELNQGYAITEQAGQQSQITGDMPEWKRSVRSTNPFSRTYRRTH